MTEATAEAPPEAPERVSVRDRLTTPRMLALYAGLAYFALAVYVIWPAPLHLNSQLYGGTGDSFGSLAFLRELVEQDQLPILPGTLHDFAAPDGYSIAWVRSLASAPSQMFLWTLAWVFGPVAGYNLFVLFGYTASGLAAFLLGRKLTGSAGAAFVIGFGLAFLPMSQGKSHGHYELAHTWVFVVMLWRMLELQQKPSNRNGFFAALSVLLALAWTPYFILFGGVMYLTLAIAGLIVGARRHEFLTMFKAQLWPAIASLVYLIGFYLAASAASAGQGLRANSDQDLITYSARLYEYFIPWPSSFLFGEETGPWLLEHIHGSNLSESTLYVGISILLLALVAIVQTLRRKVSPELRTIVWILVAVAIVAGLCSAPPQFQAGGLSIPMPSDLISKISPTWRVYARFVVIVQVALVMLAAIGIATLLTGKKPAVRALIVAALTLVVLVDLSPRQLGTNGIGGPPIYEALRKQPRGIVVEYPLLPTGQGTYDELLAQQFHDNPILNGYESGSPAEARALALADPSDPKTAQGLSLLGVKYALIRTIPGNADLPEPGPGFKLIATDPSGRLYAIRPPKSRTPASSVSMLDGFAQVERDAQGPLQWLTAPEGKIEVVADCTSCTGTVELTVDTFAWPREITITGGTRPVKATVSVGTPVKVPVRFNRKTTLTISGNPGPTPVTDVVPESGDPRSLVVDIRNARFVTR